MFSISNLNPPDHFSPLFCTFEPSHTRWVESFAAAIHESQGKEYVPYELMPYRFEGRKYMGCICPSFSSPNLEFVSAFDIISRVTPAKDKPFRQIFINTCKENGFTEDSIIHYLDYMAVTDFLISNYDRHSDNFGIMRDPGTLEFKSFAPFFDSGNSMMFYNLAEHSAGESLSEKNAGFCNTWRKTMEHVTDLNAVDVSKLPGPDVLDRIYPVERLDEKLNARFKHFFQMHIICFLKVSGTGSLSAAC